MEKSLKIDTCLYKRGNCLQELKQTDAALRDWVACIAKNKNYYSAYYNSACTYDAMLQTVQDRATPDLKITQKAMDLYEKCTKMRPTDDRAFYGMASMFFIQNKKTESMIFCNKALALNPDNTNAQALMQMLK
jgi:tetratricopeptide (TPR) repeat protein